MKTLVILLILVAPLARADQPFSRIYLSSPWQPVSVTCHVCRCTLAREEAPFWTFLRRAYPTIYAHRHCLPVQVNAPDHPRTERSMED